MGRYLNEWVFTKALSWRQLRMKKVRSVKLGSEFKCVVAWLKFKLSLEDAIQDFIGCVTVWCEK